MDNDVGVRPETSVRNTNGMKFVSLRHNEAKRGLQAEKFHEGLNPPTLCPPNTCYHQPPLFRTMSNFFICHRSRCFCHITVKHTNVKQSWSVFVLPWSSLALCDWSGFGGALIGHCVCQSGRPCWQLRCSC